MMFSSDFSYGAMTPDIPDAEIVSTHEHVGPLSRKLSKSSIGRSEDLSIPSPPLSPYQSISESETDASSSSSTTGDSTNLDTIVVLKQKDQAEFPLDTYENLPLIVNAWSNVGTKGFKRSQLSFLRSYTTRSKNYKSSIVKNYSNSRKYAPRRIVKSYINDSVFGNTHYNSDSDYNSQFEKVRTRRVARAETSTGQTSFSDHSDHIPPRVSTPKKRKPAALSSPVAPVNIDWEAIPDYSPDVSTLPNNVRCLKVEWKGQPMSLADDPLVDKLHPAEVVLASVLRLPCNLYLDSKRRLFAEKVARLRKGLAFRRTDAQKSCRIDVNKASRLFAAFEKIGWLEDDKFEQYL